MTGGLPEIADEAAARAVMAGGLGRAELEFVASLTAPLFWVIQHDDGAYQVRNGSAFFLDAGNGPFAVTAHHVLEGWRRHRESDNVVAFQIGDETLDLAGRNAIIATHAGMDIATFRITAEEVAAIGHTVLTGCQNEWPPQPPEEGRGVYYAGFPGAERIWLSQNEISFGVAPTGGVASSVSEKDVSSLVSREHLIDVMGCGDLPENYDCGGMSGGPMLMVVERRGLRSWALAGVIYEGPNPSPGDSGGIAGLEMIKARRAHFILPDGRLDVQRWDSL